MPLCSGEEIKRVLPDRGNLGRSASEPLLHVPHDEGRPAGVQEIPRSKRKRKTMLSPWIGHWRLSSRYTKIRI
jgi:hypothetical protein